MEGVSTKQRILDRAYPLAALYGLEALTIGRLAAELEMSKAGIYGHFGSKQALQLDTIGYGREKFSREVIGPAAAAPAGVPRLWAMCTTLLSYSDETGLHAGDFWVTVFHEYASRSGRVRTAVETTMNWWMRQLADLIAAAIELGQLQPADPGQIAFEIQALLSAGAHQHRLLHDANAPQRSAAAVRRLLAGLGVADPAGQPIAGRPRAC